MKDVAKEEVIGTSLAVPERFDDGRETGACVHRYLAMFLELTCHTGR